MAKKKSKKKPHKSNKGRAKSYHSNLAGPKRKKARKKSKKKRAKKSSVAKHYHSGASGYARRMEEHITAEKLATRAKRRGKRWVCGGPVRSGCGGSNSRVVK